MQFISSFWGSSELNEPECPDIPVPPPRPSTLTRKTKSDIAMNHIRRYLASRSKTIKQIQANVIEHIDNELESGTRKFGQETIKFDIMSIVDMEDYDIIHDGFSRSEKAEIFGEVKRHFEGLDMTVKNFGGYKLSINVSKSQKHMDNIDAYACQRAEDIEAYIKAAFAKIVVDIYKKSSEMGYNDTIVNLGALADDMDAWKGHWDGVHALKDSEELHIIQTLSKMLCEEGFGVKPIFIKFQLYVTWNYPSCIWRFDKENEIWIKQ